MHAGERIRLRLVNAANARIFALSFAGHAPWVIALDGHPVAPHRPERDRVVLGPGMRADLVLDCGAAPGSRHRVLDDFTPRLAYRLLDLAYSERAPLRARPPGPVPALAANPLAEPDLAKAERHRIAFGGGMMGGMGGMRWDGRNGWDGTHAGHGRRGVDDQRPRGRRRRSASRAPAHAAPRPLGAARAA